MKITPEQAREALDAWICRPGMTQEQATILITEAFWALKERPNIDVQRVTYEGGAIDQRALGVNRVKIFERWKAIDTRDKREKFTALVPAIMEAIRINDFRLYREITDGKSITCMIAGLPTFIEAYNNRFATSPRTTDNAHLDVHHSEEELGYIFSLQAKRVLSKNLTFQYKSSAFQVRSEGRGYRLRHSVVTVCENFDGEINVLYDGKALGWEKYVDGPEPIPLDDEKSVHERVDNARIDLRSKYYVKPKADHPWLTRRTQSHQQVKPPKLPKKKPDPDKKD